MTTMKKTKIMAGILASMLLMTACSNGAKPEPTQEESTEEQDTAPKSTEAAVTKSAEPTAEEQTDPVTSAAPETVQAEPTAEAAPEEKPQVAELIGKTIGDVAEIYGTELAENESGFMGCHTFSSTGADLAFIPMTITVEEDPYDSVIAGIFTNADCPLYNGITGGMSYNQLVEVVGADVAGEPSTNELDESLILMFVLDGYRFMVSWYGYESNDTPCYSIVVDQNTGM